jgi:CBS domain-containing protein
MILVRHAMTESPQTARPDMTAADAAGLMRQLDVGVIPVAEGDELLGLLTDRDLVVRVMAMRKDPMDVKLSEILTKTPFTISPDAKLAEARELMGQHQIRRLPVIKGGKLVGILSAGDVALADASQREVGEMLQEVSHSESTAEQTGGPERGTPERVQERKTEAS